VCVALFALAAGAPARVCAEDQPKKGATKEASAKEGAGKKEEDKKDIFGWALDLGIWTLVVFLVLLWVLGRFAWKPMLQGLEHREKAIHAALQEAQDARDEAQKLRAQFQAQMDRANDQVREILDSARRDAERTTGEMIAQARKEIGAERDRLHREIDVARDQALQQIWGQTAQVATLVSAKVIRRQLNPDDHRQLIDEALAELRQSDNQRPRMELG
jgi:F-type H+-transporting ATPase subunit b